MSKIGMPKLASVITLLTFLQIISAASASQPLRPPTIYFGYRSCDLNEEGRRLIEEYAKYERSLDQEFSSNIEMFGLELRAHSDGAESDAAEAIAMCRAETVMTALARNGFSPLRVKICERGDREPAPSMFKGPKQPESRRVEMDLWDMKHVARDDCQPDPLLVCLRQLPPSRTRDDIIRACGHIRFPQAD